MSKKKTHEEFIAEMLILDESIEILSKYVSSKEKVKCLCKSCGNIWYSTPTNLLKPRGCPECGAKKSIQNRTKTQEEFEKELLNKYTSISVVGEYKNNHSKIKVVCDSCGYQWSMTPTNLLKSKKGCPECAKPKRDNENRRDNFVVLGEYIDTKIKACTKCGKVLPATNEFFVKNKEGKYGLHSQCKKCQAKYYEENAEKFKKNSRQYYRENKHHKKEYQKQFYKENKEHYKEYNQQYHEENRERILEYNRQWHQENKESQKEYRKKYRIENMELGRLLTQKRRMRKKKLPATLSLKQWNKIKEDFNDSCAYCGMTEKEHLKEFSEHLHQDHFIPLSKGGGYTQNNIIPACKSCNTSKKDKDFFEWYPTYEHYSKKREKKILEHLNYSNKGVRKLSIL